MSSAPRKTKEVIRPPRLRRGDTVALWAPASPAARTSINKGAAILSGLGLKVEVPAAVSKRHGYLAGTDAQRAEAFNALVADPAITAVFCARGGYGSLRVLDLLDLDGLARSPKVLVGFSDATALLAAANRRCNLAVFHGPMAATVTDRDAAGLREALMGTGPVLLEGRLALRPGKAAGPVVGGNLTTFCHLIGTAFEPRLDGAIWFIEDRGEAPYRIDRMLTHMKMAGRMDGLAGIALGQFTDCGDIEAIYRLVLDTCPEIPILAGLDAGHGSPNLTLPLGPEAVLDAGKCRLRYRGSATKNRR
jgi:muramoyltetrapeptide carboxypeptidase